MYALLYGIVGQVSSIAKTSNPSFQGIKPIAQVVQVGTINDELRNSLWNALDTAFWSTSGFVYGNHGGHGSAVSRESRHHTASERRFRSAAGRATLRVERRIKAITPIQYASQISTCDSAGMAR